MARYLITLLFPRLRLAPRLCLAPCPSRGERGQMLVLMALVLPVLLGMTALAVDIGGYATERRDLQNAADSIALAAAQELPDEAAAQAVADTWASNNNIDPGDVTVTITQAGGGEPNPKVRVVIDREHEFSFARVLGIDSAAVGAVAAGIKTSPGGSGDVVPWAVLESHQLSTPPGDLIVLKYDSDNVSNGNFGAIRLDGNGSSVYNDTIIAGSTSVICAEGVPGCTETSPVCVDGVCQSQTGNMVGSTRTGVNWLMNNTSSQCDEFGEVFDGPAGGEYTVKNECNPYLDGSYQNERLIVVPIIEALCNGSCSLTVVSFGLFWLEGYQGSCTGNDCEVVGRFINAELTTNALTGVYDPNSSLHFARLSE